MLNKGEMALEKISKKHADLFTNELGNMKDITAKLSIKTGSSPQFLKHNLVRMLSGQRWGRFVCRLAHGKQFSKMYLNQAYLQMSIDQESRELLTISTHKGLFPYY